MQISELKIGTAFAGAAEDPMFAKVFVLPRGVAKSDIEAWDGESLIFKTTLSRAKIEDFYAHFYAFSGFRLIDSSFGWHGPEYRIFRYAMGEQAYFALLVSMENTGSAIRVGIVTCHAADACGDFVEKW